MKNSGSEEEERLVGGVFIKEYNKLHNSNYSAQPDSVDTDADLIFHSNTGAKLSVQITQATSEEEERQISNSLKEPGNPAVEGDDPDKEIILSALQKKCDMKYASPEHLILVVYSWHSIALPRNFNVSEYIKIPFKEVWIVKPGNNSYAMRIYPLDSATSKG